MLKIPPQVCSDQSQCWTTDLAQHGPNHLRRLRRSPCRPEYSLPCNILITMSMINQMLALLFHVYRCPAMRPAPTCEHSCRDRSRSAHPPQSAAELPCYSIQASGHYCTAAVCVIHSAVPAHPQGRGWSRFYARHRQQNDDDACASCQQFVAPGELEWSEEPCCGCVDVPLALAASPAASHVTSGRTRIPRIVSGKLIHSSGGSMLHGFLESACLHERCRCQELYLCGILWMSLLDTRQAVGFFCLRHRAGLYRVWPTTMAQV